jgi:hypothetical protein
MTLFSGYLQLVKLSPRLRGKGGFIWDDGKHQEEQPGHQIVLQSRRRGVGCAEKGEADQPESYSSQSQVSTFHGAPERKQRERNHNECREQIVRPPRGLLRRVTEDEWAQSEPASQHYFNDSRPHQRLSALTSATSSAKPEGLPQKMFHSNIALRLFRHTRPR